MLIIKKVTYINHLQNTLTELHCDGDCGIDQKGITNLKIIRKY